MNTPVVDSFRPMSPKFENALTLASHAHALQFRKGGQIPYISHLLGVCAIVLRAEGSEEQAIAAILHDVIEDQSDKVSIKDLKEKFGDKVVQMILECTDETMESRKTTSWKKRKLKYLESLPQISQETRLVIIADKLDNIRDIQQELQWLGNGVWDKFTGKKEGTAWFYQEMIKIIEDWKQDYQAANQQRVISFIDEFHMIGNKLFAT